MIQKRLGNFSSILSIIICFLLTNANAFGAQIHTEPVVEEEPDSIVISVPDKIMDESEGNVEIIIEDDLLDQIMEPPHGAPKTQGGGKGIKKEKIKKGQVDGFRIQVFNDGRNPGSLEARAKARQNMIASKFPKYRGKISCFSSAPNWIVRVGYFRSQSEANAALAELRGAFPKFAGEMRLVKAKFYASY